MVTNLAEENFLKAWAHEEVNDIHGEAHKLQKEFGVESSELAGRFRSWAKGKGLDPVAVSRLIDTPVVDPVSWPWASRQENQRLNTLLEQFTQDHHSILEAMAREAGIVDPIAIDAHQLQFRTP
jgi:hypothetical protein